MKWMLPFWLTSLLSYDIAALTYYGEDSKEAVARQEFKALETKYQSYVQAKIQSPGSKCSSKNIVYRREWGSLSKQQRVDYINAVKCLQRKPAQSSKETVPGARNRYDDFVAVHIQQTPYVHFSGLFLPFHRYYLLLWEKALREECGYTGYFPYWDWTISYGQPEKTTIFDGSPYSLGSNGEAIPHDTIVIDVFGLPITVPPGTGGGCVTSGPFASPQSYNISLGPVGVPPAGPGNGLGSNPRCLTRDLNGAWTKNFTKPSDMVDLIKSCTDLACWDNLLEVNSMIHGAGHFTMGGSGLDAYASPNDPAFYLHHANVDRMWAIWQGQNPRNRTNQVWGTGTAFNNPPSANVTTDTLIDFGILAPKQRVGDMGSPIDGPFCYMYI